MKYDNSYCPKCNKIFVKGDTVCRNDKEEDCCNYCFPLIKLKKWYAWRGDKK